MRVFVAGATGVVGRQLVPQLVDGGHTVVGSTRSRSSAGWLRDAGAEPVVVEPLDRAAMTAAVELARPDAVVSELTALSGRRFDLRHFDRTFAVTNDLRTRGTDILVEAARAAGARRLVAQSFAGWPSARTGGPVKTEADPLDPDPPATMRETFTAIVHLEQAVVTAQGIEGIALRYGGLYGPGTSLNDEQAEMVRARKIPVVGRGTGIWSFVHVADAAAATVAALDRGARGVYNVVDDDPAPVWEWLPHLAGLLGAKPPRRVPAWAARLAIGEAGIVLMTQMRGASNAKARAELGFEPLHPSWREGFREIVGARAQAVPAGSAA
jgi:nucleoside-diphosphate-sugar epimerase